MEVFKKRGTKERLVEMMQAVNKINLTENTQYGQHALYKTTTGSQSGPWGKKYNSNLNEELSPTINHVFEALEMLKSVGLRDEKTVMQNTDDGSYVGINGFDDKGNMYNFNFKLVGSEGDQEGVLNLNDVILEKFYFKSADNNSVIDLDENDLNEVNEKYGPELYDVVEKYIDNDQDKEIDENIEKKIDSQPFGGSKNKYQDGSGYGDEKPVNPKLRVDATELNKFVKEGKFKDFGGIMKWVEEQENDEENSENKPEVEEIPTNDEEPNGVPALDVNDVDQDGDQLEGGLGDDADVMEFDPQQIIKGIEVEMEHTKDPKIALEITMDHLKELPDYYSRLEVMEKQGKIDNQTLSCPDKNIDSSELSGIDGDENPIPTSDSKFNDLSQHLNGIEDANKELENTMLGFDTITPNKLNEQFEDQEEFDDFKYDVEQEIKTFLSRNEKMFNDAVPYEIDINTTEFGNIHIKLYSEDDSSGLEVHEYAGKESNNEYIEYVAEYRGEVNNVKISVLIFFDLFIEKSYEGRRLVFHTKIYINGDETEIEFNVD